MILICCIRFFSKGYTITYTVGEKKYEVKEIYTKKEKNEVDNYYIEMVVEDIPYAFQFYHDFSKKKKVIEDVITYKGDYACVLPIVEDKAITDLLCYKDNRYYSYSSIIGKEKELDAFVKTIDINVYDKDDWLNKSTDKLSKYNIDLYTRNAVENHTLMVTNFRGVYQITDTIEKFSIFDKDINRRELNAVVGDYYVTADYNEQQQFRTFYFLEISTGKISEAKAPSYISFDSYIQGVVEDKLYLYDCDHEKQYRITPSSKKIEEIGNEKKKIQYYTNGKWEKITTTKANRKLLFDTTIVDSDFGNFDYVYHVGGKKSGYYYLLKKVDSGYELYRSPSQNKKVILYIATINSKEDFYALEDYVYFQDKNQLKYYQDETGIRTILNYDELEFDDTILFGVTQN